LVSAKYHTLGQLLSALNAGTMKEYEGEAAPALLVTVSCAGGDGDRGVRHPGEGIMENANRFGLEGALHEKQEEAKKIRRLQVMISMVTSVIGQDPSLTVEEASELIANAKRAALAMFPDKELAFDILYKPRLQRLMKERFRIQ